MSKLTEPEARKILALKGIETLSAIASRFGVDPETISRIQTGKTWFYLQERP